MILSPNRRVVRHGLVFLFRFFIFQGLCPWLSGAAPLGPKRDGRLLTATLNRILLNESLYPISVYLDYLYPIKWGD